MNDPTFDRLLGALDDAARWVSTSEARAESLMADLEVASLRLRCLSQRLGPKASESPYLAYLRRLCAPQEAPGMTVAAGA